MQMSDGDIRGMYRDAKNKNEQIKILADLNQCSTERIRTIVEQPQEIKKTAEAPKKKPVELKAEEPTEVKPKTIKPDKPKKPDKATFDAIMAELDAGAKVEDLAKKYGVKERSITTSKAKRESWANKKGGQATVKSDKNADTATPKNRREIVLDAAKPAMMPGHYQHTVVPIGGGENVTVDNLYGVIESRLSEIRILLHDIVENCESDTLRELGIKEAYSQVKNFEEWCGSLKAITDCQ